MEQGTQATREAQGHTRDAAAPHPPLLLRSSLLAHVPHAFSTRSGGVSIGHFASLNFGNPSDLPTHQRDPATNIQQNWSRLAAAIGAPSRAIAQVHQIHGGDVITLRAGDDPVPTPTPKADAIVTDDPGLLAAVRVADCAPVLLASSDGRAVAAVHAGWRGVIADVAPRALAALRAIHPGTPILAAVGPCISFGAFEVGPEVLAAFEARFGKDPAILRAGASGKGHVDLRAALRRQLLEAGAAEVDILPGCTMTEPDRFFSHRGQKGLTGRMVAVIGPKHPADAPHAT